MTPSTIQIKGMTELLPDQKFVQKIVKFGIFVQISNELMFFKRSPFQFAFKNSFIHKIDQDFILLSENNEEIDDSTAQDLEIMNTMEATKHFWSRIRKEGKNIWKSYRYSEINFLKGTFLFLFLVMQSIRKIDLYHEFWQCEFFELLFHPF